jgi:hypothetical protein
LLEGSSCGYVPCRRLASRRDHGLGHPEVPVHPQFSVSLPQLVEVGLLVAVSSLCQGVCLGSPSVSARQH